MKTNHPENESFIRTLRIWRISAPLPPLFHETVWRRIEQEEKKSGFTPPAALSAWLESVLHRPKVALCYVTALILVGMASGLWIGQGESQLMNAQLSSRYLQSVDPYNADASNR